MGGEIEDDSPTQRGKSGRSATPCSLSTELQRDSLHYFVSVGVVLERAACVRMRGSNGLVVVLRWWCAMSDVACSIAMQHWCDARLTSRLVTDGI